jgi:hypothetical protein
MEGQTALAQETWSAAKRFTPVAGFIAAKLGGLDLQALSYWASIVANAAAAVYAITQVVLLIRKTRREKKA